MVAERWDAGRTPAHADGVGGACTYPKSMHEMGSKGIGLNHTSFQNIQTHLAINFVLSAHDHSSNLILLDG